MPIFEEYLSKTEPLSIVENSFIFILDEKLALKQIL